MEGQVITKKGDQDHRNRMEANEKIKKEERIPDVMTEEELRRHIKKRLPEWKRNIKEEMKKSRRKKNMP